MEPGMRKYLGKRILFSVKNGDLQEGIVKEVSKTNSVKINDSWFDGKEVFVKEEIPKTITA